jgi:hypothetical protein
MTPGVYMRAAQQPVHEVQARQPRRLKIELAIH